MDDLQQVVHSLDVSPHDPYRMCAVTSSPSQLLYCDYKTDKIHRVDCSTAPTTVQGEIPIVHDRKRKVLDMCTLDDLLVVARESDGVFAYALDGGELKWNVSGKLPGMQLDIDADRVTADEQGHLFESDGENRCVHVLSARDGIPPGVVARVGEQGVGEPDRVAWHGESASLIVAHEKDEVYHLSVFSCQD